MKSFAQSIARIAKYRLIRAVIRSITDAIKEGAQSFYDFTKASGGEFANYAKALDGVKAASSQMKNQVGAAFGTLYTNIAPILTSLIGLITKFANVLTMIFAKLSGAGGWYRATEGANGLAEAVGGAGAAAKEALKYLAPFDELNRLPAENQSGGGGGGGSSGGASGGYEWVDFEQFDVMDGINSIVEHIKTALGNASDWFEGIDWQAVGSDLYNRFSEAISGIDWKGLVASIFRFLGNALGAIGGVIAGFASEMWGDIKTYFLQFIDADGDGDWCGRDIVEGIFKGIWNAIVAAGQWVHDYILVPFVDAFRAAFGIHSPSTVMAEEGVFVGEGILEGIKEPFKNVAEWVNTNIVEPLKTAFSGIGEKIKLKANVISEWYTTYVKPWFMTKLQNINVGGKIIKAIKNSFPALTINPISTWYNSYIKPWFSYEKWHTIGANAKSWLKSGISLSDFNPLKNWFDDKVQPWFTWEKWKNMGINAINAIKSGLNSITFPKFHISWGWETKGTYVLGKYISVSIPWPQLSFYAKGGIVDKATLFGNSVVGEAGKEAIVPLERNTEWIGMVANGLIKELSRMSANQTDYDGMADAMYNAMSRALAENDNDRPIMLDGDVVYKKMVQRNRRETFRSGANPMMSMG